MGVVGGGVAPCVDGSMPGNCDQADGDAIEGAAFFDCVEGAVRGEDACSGGGLALVDLSLNVSPTWGSP